MKILFVTLLLPQPDAEHASAFTVFKVIRHLSQRHDISLISFVLSEKEKELARHVGQHCRSVETVLLLQNTYRKLWTRANLLSLTPMAVSSGYSKEMREKIRSVLRQDKFDVVELEYTPMGQYVSEIRNDQTQGRKAGVRGTPAFFFGHTIPNSTTIKVTKFINGAQPYINFVKVIEELLQAKK